MRDSEIVALLAAGGRQEVKQGLAAAYAAYGDRIYDYAHWMLRGTDPAAAADVTHDTFLIAVAKVGGLRNPERFRSWLYAIARNECLRVLRLAGRSDPLEYGDGTPNPALVAVEEGEGHEMSAELSRDDLRELVRTAAAGLSPKDREVFELGMRHDLQAAEIAKALGVGDNAAHAMLSRVRSQFERALGALTVARHGRASCPDLDALLSGWDGSFGPLWRKRIARHVESCATCTQVRSREVSASALLSVVPLLAAPALTRDRLFGSDQLDLVSASTAPAERAGPFDEDGFPGRAAAGRRGRAAMMVLLGVLLVLGGLGAVGWLLGPDPADRAMVYPLSTPSTSSVPRQEVVDGLTLTPKIRQRSPSETVASPSETASPSTAAATTPSTRVSPPVSTHTQPVSTPPTVTPTPSGDLEVVPATITLPRAGTGTLRVTATGGDVDWTAAKVGLADRYLQLSAASGALADCVSTSVTVTLDRSSPPGVTQLVVVFAPGGHRVTITVG
jgi:RNA polymerase sigma factor (sigma-70 family)